MRLFNCINGILKKLFYQLFNIMNTVKKLFSSGGVAPLIILLVVASSVYILSNYLTNKASHGFEANQPIQPQYKNGAAASGGNGSAPQQQAATVSPSEPLGQNQGFASASGIQSSSPSAQGSCASATVQNPSELLPRDTNSQWAQLNPAGDGDIGNVNLLKAGHHIGIDTVGQSLRNANLQIRSEPPNPQMYTGPWNSSTIEPDFMRPPLELGTGSQ